MRGFIDLDFETGQLEQLALDLNATDQQIQKALGSTFSRMGRWVRTRATRGLSGDLNVPQKILRRRIKYAMRKRGGGLKIWFGLDPVSLHELKPRQTAAGVSAGKHRRPGAFLAKGLGRSDQIVFKRQGEKRLMTKGRYRGQVRQPIERQDLDIKDQADRFIENDLVSSREFTEQFWKVFERELEWRTQIQK